MIHFSQSVVIKTILHSSYFEMYVCLFSFNYDQQIKHSEQYLCYLIQTFSNLLFLKDSLFLQIHIDQQFFLKLLFFLVFIFLKSNAANILYRKHLLSLFFGFIIASSFLITWGYLYMIYHDLHLFHKICCTLFQY